MKCFRDLNDLLVRHQGGGIKFGRKRKEVRHCLFKHITIEIHYLFAPIVVFTDMVLFTVKPLITGYFTTSIRNNPSVDFTIFTHDVDRLLNPTTSHKIYLHFMIANSNWHTLPFPFSFTHCPINSSISKEIKNSFFLTFKCVDENDDQWSCGERSRSTLLIVTHTVHLFG